MPKKKPTDLVLDESVIREAEMARTLDEQFEEGYAALQPILEEQLPLTAARMLYYLGALWGFLKRLKPEDLATDYEMTVEELSAFLPEKPAVQTIYGWVSEEKIPYIKRGKRLFFVKRAIIRWNTDGRPVNPDNITEIAQAYVANNRPRREETPLTHGPPTHQRERHRQDALRIRCIFPHPPAVLPVRLSDAGIR